MQALLVRIIVSGFTGATERIREKSSCHRADARPLCFRDCVAISMRGSVLAPALATFAFLVRRGVRRRFGPIRFGEATDLQWSEANEMFVLAELSNPGAVRSEHARTWR
jgi:hypothetical protein